MVTALSLGHPDSLIRSMSVGKIFAGNQSAEFDSRSKAFAASEKVLVPGNIDDDDDASMVTEGPTSFSEESQVDILVISAL